MSCETLQEQLFTEPDVSRVLAENQAHLAECPACTELAERILAGEQGLDEALDAFADGGDFDAAFARAGQTPQPANRPWGQWLAVAAAAAVVLATVAMSVRTEPEVAFGPACADFEALDYTDLSDETRTCLHDGLMQSHDPEERDLASRVLLAYYWTVAPSGPDWEQQLRWHLADGQLPADPELTYKAALHFRKTGDADAALDATQRTWDHLSEWPDDLQEQRTANLLAIEATATFKRYQDRPEDGARYEAAVDAAKAWAEVRPQGARKLCEVLIGTPDCR